MKILSLAKPHIIVLVGVPGAGKTFFADKFSEFFAIPTVSTEKLRLFGGERATAYMLQEMFKTKSHFIFDGDTSSKKLRGALTLSAKKNGYEILFVWLQTDAETARKRYEAKTRLKDFDKQLADFVPPVQQGDVLVISGKHTFGTQMKMVLGRLVGDSRSRRPIPIAPSRALRK